ncbi:MAG TPA: methylmalonyl Co-A mutase-associated GTPase MeaB [Flavisolibacter sp.]
MWQQLFSDLEKGDTRALARCISLIENESEGHRELLRSLPSSLPARVIGITGPPGAGKSTLVDALIGAFIDQGSRVAVLCVDPSSPFHLGALLGDRIRMSAWYTHPDVFIRSLATRGSMGGLHPHIIEITDVVKAAGYDYVIIETVGVGQSEVEIAGLADTTVVVMVPEGGDEVQTMKAGLMEIADIFVVNKADRPGADLFIKYLRQMLAPAFHNHQVEIPIIKTIASEKKGIDLLYEAIRNHSVDDHHRRTWLLAEKAYYLIRQRRMRHISKDELQRRIGEQVARNHFNLYAFVEEQVNAGPR